MSPAFKLAIKILEGLHQCDDYEGSKTDFIKALLLHAVEQDRGNYWRIKSAALHVEARHGVAATTNPILTKSETDAKELYKRIKYSREQHVEKAKKKAAAEAANNPG